MPTPRNLMVVRYVNDMGRAFAFHRDGLGLIPIAESAGWSMLACGDAIVGLHAIYPGVSERPVGYAGLNLEVDDLDVAIARAVGAGAKLVETRDPEANVPVRLGVLLDPDGNGFELRQTVAI
jgi:predicted enzyme related to lactoylglutathione lyase